MSVRATGSVCGNHGTTQLGLEAHTARHPVACLRSGLTCQMQKACSLLPIGLGIGDCCSSSLGAVERCYYAVVSFSNLCCFSCWIISLLLIPSFSRWRCIFPWQLLLQISLPAELQSIESPHQRQSLTVVIVIFHILKARNYLFWTSKSCRLSCPTGVLNKRAPRREHCRCQGSCSERRSIRCQSLCSVEHMTDGCTILYHSTVVLGAERTRSKRVSWEQEDNKQSNVG